MDRSEILKETARLFDQNCRGCKKWASVAKQRHHKTAQEYCEQHCVISKQMRDLGDLLTYGKPTEAARELIKDVYLDEIQSGLTEKQIREKYGINWRELYDRKLHWGLAEAFDPSLMLPITKEIYLEYKANGFPDELIAKKHRMPRKRLSGLKQEWGIQSSFDLNTIKEGPNGEEISALTYIRYKDLGWSDSRIAKHWLIGLTTIQRKKRAWRLAGYDVDRNSRREANG